MELRVLNYFLAIAREQSIVHAAESLHLSQPTLSIQIKGLGRRTGGNSSSFAEQKVPAKSRSQKRA